MATSNPTDFTSYYLGYANPEAGYEGFLSKPKIGFGGIDPLSNFARAQENRLHNQWLAAGGTSSFEQFLKARGFDSNYFARQNLEFGDPGAAFYQYLNQRGMTGNDPRSQFALQQQDKEWQAYRAALTTGQLPTTDVYKTPQSHGGHPGHGGHSWTQSLGENGVINRTSTVRPQTEQGAFRKQKFAPTIQVTNPSPKPAKLLSREQMGFYSYLNKNAPDVGAQFDNQSPEQRGINTATNSPRTRWSF